MLMRWWRWCSHLGEPGKLPNCDLPIVSTHSWEHLRTNRMSQKTPLPTNQCHIMLWVSGYESQLHELSKPGQCGCSSSRTRTPILNAVAVVNKILALLLIIDQCPNTCFHSRHRHHASGDEAPSSQPFLAPDHSSSES